MREIYEFNMVKGEFFSPISIIVSIGLIGIGIGLCKDIISKNIKGIILRR